jgi:hypothetical protein
MEINKQSVEVNIKKRKREEAFGEGSNEIDLLQIIES